MVLSRLSRNKTFEIMAKNYANADTNPAWKVSKYGVFSGPYFPVFELNTGIYSVNLRI